MTNGWRCASRCRFPGIPESVLLDFFDAEPLHVRLTQAEDEAGLAKFEVDLNEGRLDQVGEVLQMNGGGLVRTPKSLLFIRSGAFGSVWSDSWRFVAVRGGSWRFVAVRGGSWRFVKFTARVDFCQCAYYQLINFLKSAR